MHVAPTRLSQAKTHTGFFLLIYCVVQCLLVFQVRDIVVVVDVGLTDASIVVIVVAATFANSVGF